MTDDPLLFDPGDPVSWMMQSVPGGKPWPTDAATLAAAMGYGTWASIWQCDEASGALSDSVGGITLTNASSPTYRNAGAFGGDYAVGFNSTTDSFAAASATTYDLDAVTSLAIYFCAKLTTAVAFTQFLGKNMGGGAAAHYGALVWNTSGHVYFNVGDGATSVSPNIAVDHQGAYHDYLLCIDRTAQRAQLITNLGETTASDITAIGTLTNAVPLKFGRDAGILTFTGNIAYCAVATGGVDTLRTNAATAIANIRRYTGR